MRAATVVQVLQDLFYVLLHVLFYLWSLLNITFLLRYSIHNKTVKLFIKSEWQVAKLSQRNHAPLINVLGIIFISVIHFKATQQSGKVTNTYCAEHALLSRVTWASLQHRSTQSGDWRCVSGPSFCRPLLRFRSSPFSDPAFSGPPFSGLALSVSPKELSTFQQQTVIRWPVILSK